MVSYRASNAFLLEIKEYNYLYFLLFSLLKTVDCKEKFYFFCSTPSETKSICPEGHISYKGKCILYKNEMLTFKGAKHECAKHGGIVLPIKTKGMYEFIKNYSLKIKTGDIFIGFNLTVPQVYTDGTSYTNQSFKFDGDDTKLNGLACAFLKRGIKYLVRGAFCEEQYNFYCEWTGNTLHFIFLL